MGKQKGKVISGGAIINMGIPSAQRKRDDKEVPESKKFERGALLSHLEPEGANEGHTRRKQVKHPKKRDFIPTEIEALRKLRVFPKTKSVHPNDQDGGILRKGEPFSSIG